MEDALKQKKQAWTVGVVLINVSLYALAFQLQRPIEPFLVKRLGADDREYGRLQSFFSMVQSLGSPIVGLTLDIVGARGMFVIVFLSSALSYGILAQATTMSLLYLSKVPSVLQAGFLVAQALIASTTRGQTERAAALGRLTTAYTVGATLGPAAGGFFGARGDYYLGARWAVGASLLSAALALLLPKDDEKPISKEKTTTETSKLTIVGRVYPWLVAKFVTGVTNSALGATIPLVLRDLGFDEQKLGFGMSATSVLVAIVGAFFVGPLSATFGGGLATLSLVVKALAVLVLAAAFATTSPLVCAVVVAGHGAVSHVLATALTTATTGAVNPSEQGALLGLEHGLFAVARIFGPTLGTSTLAKLGILPLALFCAASDALLALLFPTMAARVGGGAGSTGGVPATEEKKLT